MVTLADAVVPFRTYPHIDMKDAGAQAMRLLLQRIARGTPWARAFRQLEFWLPLGSQCTLLAPMNEVMAERASLAERMDVAELAFCFGFPYADFPIAVRRSPPMPIRRRRPTRRPMHSSRTLQHARRTSGRSCCQRQRRWLRRSDWLMAHAGQS